VVELVWKYEIPLGTPTPFYPLGDKETTIHIQFTPKYSRINPTPLIQFQIPALSAMTQYKITYVNCLRVG